MIRSVSARESNPRSAARRQARIAELLENSGEPEFHELEPDADLAPVHRLAQASRVSQPMAQALSARTVGLSAGVGRRKALAGSVDTATVLPVMSKNSTE